MKIYHSFEIAKLISKLREIILITVSKAAQLI